MMMRKPELEHDQRIEECRTNLARAEQLVRGAPDEVAAELHRQKATLYRAQLDLLTRRPRVAAVEER